MALFLSGGFRQMAGAPFIRLGRNIQLVAGMISLCQSYCFTGMAKNRVKALQQMTPALPLGHELEAEWRFRVIHERNVMPVAAVMAELLTHPLIHANRCLRRGALPTMFSWTGLSPARREFILPHRTDTGLFASLPFLFSRAEGS